MDRPSPPIIDARGLAKRIQLDGLTHTLLAPVNIQVHAGELLVITGSSGSGKSTLLNILACLDAPSEGSYRFNQQLVLSLTTQQLAKFRAQNISVVFQNYLLIAQLSVIENVTLPLYYQNVHTHTAKQQGMHALERLNIAEHANKRPHQLSGGQQQRVSIARALISKPKVLFADEPTGALDDTNSHAIMQQLARINQHEGTTIVMVTHDSEMAQYCNRQIRMHELTEAIA